jgi:hypothetical protein
MTPYYIFIFSNYILLLLSKKFVFKISNKIKVNIFFLLSLFSYIVFYGFRYDVGADYWNYKYFIEKIWENGYHSAFEPGFNFFINVLGYLNFNYRAFLVLTGVITGISLYFYCYKFQKKYYEISLFIYFTTFPLFFQSFNIMRQYLAIFIFVFALYNYFNEKYITFAILAFVAINFHLSIVIILVLFPLLLKKNNKITLLIILFLGLIIYFLDIYIYLFIFLKYIFSFIGFYENYLTNPVPTKSFLLLIYDFSILFFLIWNKNKIIKASKINNFFLNSYLAYFLIKGLFPFEIFYRTIFFLLMSKIILIPKIIDAFKGNGKKIIYIFIIIIHILAFTQGVINTDSMGVNNYNPYQIELNLSEVK